ncbi:MAG: STAS domain-containing protein [Planctomycetales bacterium]|nr:STAS domain-containing protein [Planctomycetales bacterium]MCA9183498.1 STAS domain-containing protein [Planctomycetales bacterium]MCC7337232.1 STAS domain-containing protein [Pirellulaceae bacterium]
MILTMENQADGVCYLSLAGKISQTAVASQADELSRLLGISNLNQQILISLQQTDYIDSSGIGWLLATDKTIRDCGGRLVLHSVPLDIQHVFGLMKLNKVLNITKDKAQATSFATGQNHGG